MPAHGFSIELRYEHTPLHGAYAPGIVIIKFRLRLPIIIAQERPVYMMH